MYLVSYKQNPTHFIQCPLGACSLLPILILPHRSIASRGPKGAVNVLFCTYCNPAVQLTRLTLLAAYRNVGLLMVSRGSGVNPHSPAPTPVYCSQTPNPIHIFYCNKECYSLTSDRRHMWPCLYIFHVSLENIVSLNIFSVEFSSCTHIEIKWHSEKLTPTFQPPGVKPRVV